MTTLAKYYENRPLKHTSSSRHRKSLGPPDRYPQDKDQAEDRLSTHYLKHGFDVKNQNLVSVGQEIGSATDQFCKLFAGPKAKDHEVENNEFSEKLVTSLNKIFRESLKKRELPKSDQKRKLTIPKECVRNFQQVLPGTVNKIRRDFEMFLEDLASQTPFEDLLNPKKRNCRIPFCLVGGKKGEMYFFLLAEFNVPVSRAAWYLKVLANVMPAVTDSSTQRGNSRRRTDVHVISEWTKYMIAFLDEMWNILTVKLPSQNQSNALFKKPTTLEQAEQYWLYAQDILRYLFTENMLDKEDIISWILKVGERLRAGDEYQLRQMVAFFQLYLSDIMRNNLNSRRLAYIVAQMLYWLKVDMAEETASKVKKEEAKEDKMEPPTPPPPGTPIKAENQSTTSQKESIEEDPKWRSLIHGLNMIMQLLTLHAPGALVWYEPVSPTLHPGSPLDLLTMAPSSMFGASIAPGVADAYGGEQHYQQQLRVMEREISKRSLAVEVKWSWDKCRDPQMATIVGSVLHILNSLDSNEIEFPTEKLTKETNKSSPDTLKVIYDAIFSSAQNSEQETDAIVATLCDWATTSYRAGIHRGVFVAKLLTYRQDIIEENERKMVPHFQEYLFNYLHDVAPSVTKDRPKEFFNLIVLFGELIRHDIFSHQCYVSSLISRGEVSTNNKGADNNQYLFLKHIPIPFSLTTVLAIKDDEPDEQKGERSQRAIALYGIGSARRQARKERKNLINNLYNLFLDQNGDEHSNLYVNEHVKLFQKKSYYDRWNIAFFLIKKFVVPFKKLVAENTKSITSPSMMKLPSKNGMSCLVDLILESGNALNVLELIHQLISQFHQLEKFWKKLKSTGNPDEMKNNAIIYNTHVQYTRQIGLIFTGVLKQTQKYLLLEPELCYKTFINLNKLLQHVEPAECFASERVMLIHINKLVSVSKFITEKMIHSSTSNTFDEWRSKSQKIKDGCERSIEAGTSNFKYNSAVYDDLWKLSFNDTAKIKRWSKKNLQSSVDKGDENRYSLASAFTIQVGSPNTNNLRLNELGRLAAELTSMVPPIAAEWLGILAAIMPTEGNKGYSDVCTRIDTTRITLAEQLAVLYGIMMARGALQMRSVITIVLESLLFNSQQLKRQSDQKLAQRTKDNVRLCCAFLLNILRSAPPKDFLADRTDRHLLKDVQAQLSQSVLVNILKTLMSVASDLIRPKLNAKGDYVSHGVRVGAYKSSDSSNFLKNAPKDVADMAYQVLKVIASEAWVKEKCLSEGESFVTNLLDKKLIISKAESQLLIELVSHPDVIEDEIKCSEAEQYIQGILHNLKLWTIRQSLVKLLHLFRSVDAKKESLSLEGVNMIDQYSIKAVARLVTEVFQSTPRGRIKVMKSFPGMKKREVSSIWLLAPLIAKLPDELHQHIHNQATVMLEMGTMFNSDANSVQVSQQPFLNLILACIQRQPIERKSLMDKLVTQLNKFITDNQDKVRTMGQAQMNSLVGNLFFRLSLLGGMLDTILREGPIPVSNILISMVTSGIADQERHPDLFYTCIDMLGLILHSLGGGDNAVHDVMGIPTGCTKRESTSKEKNEKKKIEQKIAKRLLDYLSKGLYDSVRQLIPIQKEAESKFEIIKYEKIPYNEQRKWRSGLRAVGAEKVNPWDLIEGLKEKPIDLSWFGASRSDKEPEEWQYRERIGQIPQKRKFEEWLQLQELPSEDEEPPDSKKATDQDLRNSQMNQQNSQLGWGQMNRFPGPPQMNPGQNQLYSNQPGAGGVHPNAMGNPMNNPAMQQGMRMPTMNTGMPQGWGNRPNFPNYPNQPNPMNQIPNMNTRHQIRQHIRTNTGMNSQFPQNTYGNNFNVHQMRPGMTQPMYNRPMNAMNMSGYPRGAHPMNNPYGQQNPMGMQNPNMMNNMNNVPGNHYRMHPQGQGGPHMMTPGGPHGPPGGPMGNYQPISHMQHQQRYRMMNQQPHPGMNPMNQSQMNYQGNQRFPMRQNPSFNPQMIQNQQQMMASQAPGQMAPNPQQQQRIFGANQPYS